MSTIAARIKQEADAAEAQIAAIAAGTPLTADPDTPAANEAAAPQDAPKPVETKAAVSAEVVAAPPEPQEQARVTDQALTDLEQRYRSLQGMFAKQGAEYETLKRQLDEVLRGQKEQQEQRQQHSAGVSPKDIEEYGEDLIRVIRSAASEVAQNVSAVLDARIKRLEQGLGEATKTAKSAASTAAVSAQERFYTQLTDKVPDWEQLNNDRKFLTWLGEADSLSGAVRQDLLEQAYQNLDVARTAQFFQTFKRETGTPAPASDGAKGKPAQVDLATLAAPSASAGAASTTNSGPQGRKYTQAEVEKVYDDYARGRMRREEFVKQEADIQRALVEGRIT